MNLRTLLDAHLGAALVAAPLFWALLAFWVPIGAGTAWIADRPAQFVLLVFAYPLAEELFFRGALQTWLLERAAMRQRVLMLSRANLLVTALFCVTHGVLRAPLVGVIVLLPSLVLGHLRERTCGLPGAMLVHVVWNAGFFLLWPPPAPG